jgi:hypothetical protein
MSLHWHLDWEGPRSHGEPSRSIGSAGGSGHAAPAHAVNH